MAPRSTDGGQAISLADNILVQGVSLLLGYGPVPMQSSKLDRIALGKLADLAHLRDETKSAVAGVAIIVNLRRIII